MGASITLRADASSRIGVGHVMRSLTLGHALVQRGVEVTLATHDVPDALAQRAARFGVRVVDPARLDGFVVLDGYNIAAPIGPHAVIDDNREAPLERAALVLNQNLHATPEMYADVAARLLLGSRYALLRPELERQADPVRGDASRVLVAMGGADPCNLTASIARSSLDVDVRVAVGAANPRRAELTREFTIAEPDLVQSLAWADVAIIGAGTMLWEVAYVGVPTVAVVVADNQRAAAAAAHEFVVTAPPEQAAALAHELLADAPRRNAMRVAGQALFDGEGASRVADAILEVAK